MYSIGEPLFIYSILGVLTTFIMGWPEFLRIPVNDAPFVYSCQGLLLICVYICAREVASFYATY